MSGTITPGAVVVRTLGTPTHRGIVLLLAAGGGCTMMNPRIKQWLLVALVFAPGVALAILMGTCDGFAILPYYPEG